MYQRGQDPILVNIDKVAKERHLYSFPTEDGELSTEMEKWFQTLEDASRPILERLNTGPGDVNISADEESVLATFAAFQSQRTPGHRRAVADLMVKASKALFQGYANSEAFRQSLEEHIARGENIDGGEVREKILEGDYEIVADEKFAMLTALETARELIPTFLMKRLWVLRSESEYFLTCDYPVLKMGGIQLGPGRGSGFLNSNVALAIGRRAALFWGLDGTKLPSERPDQTIVVRSHRISGAEVRQIGKAVIAYAERFVFSAEKNRFAKKLFDRTERSPRIVVHNPFDGSGSSQGATS